MAWYSEKKSPMGEWVSQTTVDKPNAKGVEGHASLRAVQQVQEKDASLPLDVLRRLYGPGGYEHETTRKAREGDGQA